MTRYAARANSWRPQAIPVGLGLPLTTYITAGTFAKLQRSSLFSDISVMARVGSKGRLLLLRCLRPRRHRAPLLDRCAQEQPEEAEEEEAEQLQEGGGGDGGVAKKSTFILASL